MKSELSGFNFQCVTCINEDQVVEEYLQFQVPGSCKGCFPSNHVIGNRTVRVDHALPYAPPVQSSMRPPCEQSVYEHWKLSVLQTPVQRKGHLNVIEKVENSPGSHQRYLQLREISVHHEGNTSSAYYETEQVPLCFYSKEIPFHLALGNFAQWCRSFKAIEGSFLDFIEKQDISKVEKCVSNDCTRLCLATVVCQGDQSLKLGM